jgi:tyrosinase
MSDFKFTAFFWGSLLFFALFQSTTAGILKCTDPVVRKEWRKLTSQEKGEYLSAVKCLHSIPAKTCESTPGAVSRFDDFQGIHIRQTNYIHFVGHFQPWHRYFVATYERSLREECGYVGAQPYWDWALDTTDLASFLAAPVFDSEAFGGNGPYVENGTIVGLVAPGRTGGGCVQDGAFKDLVIHLGPKTNIDRNDQCLTRDFNPPIALRCITSAMVAKALSQTNFGWFDKVVQGGITPAEITYHGGGHLGVGGELGTIADIYASPGDPLFYLHHCNLDRLWWKWQSQDLEVRLKDISGPIKQFDFPFGNGTTGGNVTLAFQINLNELSGNVTLAEVMDIKGGTLCYDYE